MHELDFKTVNQLQYITPPSRKRILVLAPHPDDEIIGCGGTLAKYVAYGNQIKVLYFFNCSELRIEELQAGLNIIGISEWEVAKYCVTALKNELYKFSPNEIFVPHLQDRNPHHFFVHYLFALCLQDVPFINLTINEYEVWNTLTPNVLVNVTDYWKQKMSALACHNSQTKLYNYAKIVELLARYRCCSMHPSSNLKKTVLSELRKQKELGLTASLPWSHAEAFFQTNTKGYLRKYNDALSYWQ